MRTISRFTPILAIFVMLAGCNHANPFLNDIIKFDYNKPELTEKHSYRFLERNIEGLCVASLEELVLLPEPEVDIATAALLVSKEVNPGLNIKKYLEKLDSMARELAEQLRRPLTPRQVADRFRKYLFEYQKFRYEGGTSPLLDKILDTKKMSCAGSTLLYLCIAERLGIPLAKVSLPSCTDSRYAHCFVRYLGNSVKLNIETTERGIIVPDSYYEIEYKWAFRMHPEAFQKTLSKKDVVVKILTNIAGVQIEKGNNIEESYQLLQKAAKLWPNHIAILTQLSNIHARRKELKKAIICLEKIHSLAPNDCVSNYGLLYMYSAEREYDKAVELGRQFLKTFPDHPDADKTKLMILYNSARGNKYLLKTVEECDAAIKFVKEYLKQHESLPEEGVRFYNRLHGRIERIRKKLLEKRER